LAKRKRGGLGRNLVNFGRLVTRVGHSFKPQRKGRWLREAYFWKIGRFKERGYYFLLGTFGKRELDYPQTIFG